MPRRKKSRRRIARPQLGTMPNLALNSGYQNRKLRTAKWGSEMAFNSLFAAQQFKGAACRRWVKIGKARCEHLFSALPLRADVAQRNRHVRFVPEADLCVDG